MNKSMDVILKELRRPFHSSKVKFKVASNTKGKSAICVAYVDARDVQERFNSVCEGFWSNTFREIYEGGPFMQIVAVEATIKVVSLDYDISHSDIGAKDNENEDGSFGHKALYSDALKRAAVPFGVAAPLYSMPQLWLEKNDIHFKMNGDKPGYMKDAGEDVLRQRYIKYLKDEGVDKYGLPL